MRLAVTRPQRWPFPCQDKRRCQTATIAVRPRLRGNKPEPQPCGSVSASVEGFQPETKIMSGRNVLQLATDVLRSVNQDIANI